jgi:hypothetical protein
MKTLFIVCLCSLALAMSVFAQGYSATPQPASSPVASATVSSASPSPADQDDLEKAIEKKVRKHFNFTIGGHDSDENAGLSHHGDEDLPWMAVPIVAIIFTMVFGAPVLIVFVIMLASYFKARSLHRTVRTMVEKGQPVPAALFAPPAAQKQRSDLRRGVTLVMVGIGLMVFFGAVNDWEGGAWALGIIPFLIGCGYLLVWKLEGGKKNEIPPPPPTP